MNTGPETSARKRHSKATLAGLALLSILPFLNGLNGDFTYDDKLIIRDNARIASPSHFGEIFTTHYFGGPLNSATAYRPLVLVTYAVQRWTTGARPFWFHLGNVLLHVGTTLLFFSWLASLGFPRGPALSAGALFAVLPIHVEAVTGLVGRAEVLAALLVVASARLWIAATGEERLRPGPFLGSLSCFLAAVFVKENAIVLPALVFLGEMVRPPETPWRARGIEILKKRGRALLGFAVPVVILFGARKAVLKGFLMSKEAGVFDLENPLVVMTPLLRFANASMLVFRYIAKTFIPAGLAADHSAYALPLASRISDPRALAAVACLGLAAAGTLLLARRRPLAAFGAALFMATLLPTSNLVFPIGTIFAERLMYLPSAGLLCVAVALLAPAARTVPRPSRFPWRETLLTMAVLTFAVVTFFRNRVFANDTALYADMIVKVPNSAKAHYNFAFDTLRRGNPRELPAVKTHLERATTIFPRYYDAWALLGKLEWDAGRLDRAIECYRSAVKIFRHYENGHWGLAKTLEAAGRREEAQKVFQAGLLQFPDSYPLLYHHAAFLEASGDLESAEKEWGRAARVSKGTPRAFLAHALILVKLGREEAAWDEARRGIAADRKNVEARLFLAERYEKSGKILGAAGELGRACRTKPADPVPATRLAALAERHSEIRSRLDISRIPPFPDRGARGEPGRTERR